MVTGSVPKQRCHLITTNYEMDLDGSTFTNAFQA